MKISFAIGVHNEGHYVVDLLTRLTNWITSPQTQNDNHEYEIVVVDDFSDDHLTVSTIDLFLTIFPSLIKYRSHKLNGNFAEHKNFLNSQCSGDWILNLDADEYLKNEFLEILPLIIESNPEVEAFSLPRVNTVDGLTLEHVRKWGWVITQMDGYRTVKTLGRDTDEYKLLEAYGLILSEESGFVTFHRPIICWPDIQTRLYRNSSEIKWVGKVHERLQGFTHFSILPQDPHYAIQHHKEIDRQETQNNYYEMLIK